MGTPSLFKLADVKKLITNFLMVALSALLLLTLGCSPRPIVNVELAELAKQDQLDRSQGSLNMEKDLSRLKRVQELENSDSLQHALDFYHAALIYQHGTEPLHYLKAYLLSEVALTSYVRAAEENGRVSTPAFEMYSVCHFIPV